MDELRTPRPALLLVLALAAGLRLWHLDAGLPDFLDEALPFRHALGMWNQVTGAIDWNPRFFVYPSLSIYLFLLLQRAHLALGLALGWFQAPADYALAFQIDPTPMVIPARLLCVAFDLVTVWLVWRLGERLRPGAGVIAGLVAACAPMAILLVRNIYTDTLLATCAVAAVERTAAWQRAGGTGRLVAATALVGLAAGAKYPGAALLVPLGWALWTRLGARGLLAWPLCALGAALVFLATTPFALVEPALLARDLTAVRQLSAEGHFGNFERAGFRFQAHSLAVQIGWPAAALLAGSLALTVAGLVRRRPRGTRAERPADPRPLVWLAFLVLAVPVALARVESARYLVPVLPIAALLAADAGLALAGRASRARRLALAAVAALLVIPPLVAGIGAAATRGDATRIAARRWLEAHLPPDQVVLQEMYAAPLLDQVRRFEVTSSGPFAAARPELRRAYEARPWFSAVTLPMLTSGHVTVPVRTAEGRVTGLRVVDQAGDLNPVSYDPRLLAGVDVVATSSIVRSRFEADPARYPAPLRFYALLDSTARLAARFVARGAEGGPEIRIYRLTPRTRAAVAALGPLPPLWWLAGVARGYREAFAAATGGAGDADTLTAGEPAPWVASLRPVFEQRFARFAQALAIATARRGAAGPARALAAAVITMIPEDVGACLTYTSASRRLGAWEDARRALERTHAAITRQTGQPPGVLMLEYAGVLAGGGQPARAGALYESLAVAAEPAVAAEARARLADAPPRRGPALPIRTR